MEYSSKHSVSICLSNALLRAVKVRSMVWNGLLLIVLLFLSSCASDRPSKVLSSGAMEDVLYDMHMAQALAQQETTDSFAYNVRFDEEAVLQKHGIDAQTFDRSLQWYERHTDDLVKIYDKLSKRFGDSGSSSVAVGGLKGDTLNIWKGAQSLLLCSQSSTHYSYEQKADTSLHAGDVLEWRFLTDWHYHEGERSATAIIVLHYDNDSTEVYSNMIYSSGVQIVSARIGDCKLKDVEVVLYQSVVWSERPKILSVSGIQLLRVRPQKEKKEEKATESKDSTAVKGDSAQAKSVDPRLRIRDSLLRLDTLRETRNHFQ